MAPDPRATESASGPCAGRGSHRTGQQTGKENVAMSPLTFVEADSAILSPLVRQKYRLSGHQDPDQTTDYSRTAGAQ